MNPFTSPARWYAAEAAPSDEAAIARARQSLRVHLGERAAVERDRLAARRTHPAVLLALGASVLTVVGGACAVPRDGPLFAVLLGGLAATAAAGRIWRDAHLLDVARAQDVEDVCRGYWNALAERPSLAWAILAPSVRARSVSFASPKSFFEWTSWVRVVNGCRGRAVADRDVAVITTSEDYAVTVVPVRVGMHDPPVGVAWVTFLGFVVASVPGALFARHLAQKWHWVEREHLVRQRWLRGSNGAWYLLDPIGHEPERILAAARPGGGLQNADVHSPDSLFHP